MQKPEHFLAKAFHLAIDTYTKGNYPIGALLVMDNREIEGQNKVVSEQNNRFHAEMDILQRTSAFQPTQDKKVLFVTLEPCNNCAKALCEFGIDEVYYILEDPSWGWRGILEQAGVKVHQVRYWYEEYLDLMIEFMGKHGNYDEVLHQYISIRENGKNTYQEQLDKTICDTFIDIPKNLADYEVRKIVYNNTLSYLRNALLRTPQDKHGIIFSGYSGDVERIISFCQKLVESDSTGPSEECVKWLHKTLYPDGYVQKSRTLEWDEFVWMVPGEYKKIDIISKDNADKNIYLRPEEVERWMQKIIRKYRENRNNPGEAVLYFLADFSRVHPFGDGNGRVVDILTDLLLLKNNLQPLYLGDKKEKDKKGFYRILDEVYETRNLTSFYGFVKKHTENGHM